MIQLLHLACRHASVICVAHQLCVDVINFNLKFNFSRFYFHGSRSVREYRETLHPAKISQYMLCISYMCCSLIHRLSLHGEGEPGNEAICAVHAVSFSLYSIHNIKKKQFPKALIKHLDISLWGQNACVKLLI